VEPSSIAERYEFDVIAKVREPVLRHFVPVDPAGSLDPVSVLGSGIKNDRQPVLVFAPQLQGVGLM
jgi:hypothetical protein